MAGRLEGKVVLITGVARGQGRSHAVRMAQEGADIIGIDVCADAPGLPYELPSRGDLDAVAAEVTNLGRRMTAHVADVADRTAVREAIEAGVAELGHLDVVIANAGIFALGERPIEMFFRTVDACLVGMHNTVSGAYEHLGNGASIIIIGSVAAFAPLPESGPSAGPGGLGYIYAKRGVPEFVQTLARVLAPRMIRVNGLHPTNVNTPMILNDDTYAAFVPDVEHATVEDARPVMASLQALPIPWVEPGDVSNAAVFLASDESRYVTGTQLRVDAGSALRYPPRQLM